MADPEKMEVKGHRGLLGCVENKDLQDISVPQAQLEFQDFEGREDKREMPASMDAREMREKWDWLDRMEFPDHKESLVRMELTVSLDVTETLGYQERAETRVTKDLVEKPAEKEARESRVQWDHQDNAERLEPSATQELTARLVPEDRLD